MSKKVKNYKINGDRSIASKCFKTICLVLLIAYSLTIIVTFLFAFLTSFKTGDAYDMNLLSLPFGKEFNPKNYSDVIKVAKISVPKGNTTTKVNMLDMLVNSISFSVGGAFFATLSCCITAYAVSKFKNWLSGVIYAIVIVCMALPIVGSLPSELQVLINLNLYNKRIGLILLASSFLGMHFLVFYATFSSIPKDFSEAAKIDGASEFMIMVRIILPLAKFAFITIFLLKFMALWNNYETPLIHTPSFPVLAYGVFKIYKNDIVASGSIRATTMPHKLAASMLVLIPMLVIFLFSHKRLIGNVSMGGIKG